ncbi:uncharacterized protein LOC106661478 isoform X2 [Cimex lectularius]|uniref:F-box domain-containing protein n=1 Tax=Cimex lectularius TaxID=79782 RepID=A0A8I6R794_CIMLE|nr:uncharacterized protein LOC106661478 isoform X2 [Cimex lectularius]
MSVTDFKLDCIEDNTEVNHEAYFDNFPLHLIDKILLYLPISSLGDIALVSSLFKSRVCSVLREIFFRLDSDINEEIQSLKLEIMRIPSEEEIVLLRLPLFRSFFICEMLRVELNVFKVADRCELYSNRQSILGMAKILNLFNNLYEESTKRELPPWHVNDGYTVSMAKLTKTYLELRANEEAHDEYFGCRILELLNLFLYKVYKIKVRYIPLANSCTIEAQYEISQQQFIQAPPKLIDPTSHIPTSEDKKNIIRFLMNLVRTNSRIILRNEQYFRELEGTRGTQSHEFLFGTTQTTMPRSRVLSRQFREYRVLPNPVRKIELNDGLYEIEEEFKTRDVILHPIQSTCGIFKCDVKMRCSMDTLPRHVADSWQRLKVDLFAGKLISSPLWSVLAHHLRNDYTPSGTRIGGNNIQMPNSLNCVMNLRSTFLHRDADLILRFQEP